MELHAIREILECETATVDGLRDALRSAVQMIEQLQKPPEIRKLHEAVYGEGR